jgi:hypothetical protein
MEIVQAGLASIDANPFRALADYPYVETKIDALKHSIEDVGLWPGVIARKKGNRYQIAFGHHRIEAARQSELKRVPLIIEDLTDKQMLQYMGRENLEDYNADFIVMLESWEAAISYLGGHAPVKPQDIEIARLLGWTDGRNDSDSTRSNQTARACADASRLIAGGYINRKDLRGLAVKSVRELCGRIVAQHEQIERMAERTKRPAREVEVAKRASGNAGKRVAKDVREGNVAPRDIRGQVDVEAYRHAREAKKQTPLFSMFGKSLAESIAKIAKSDGIGEKLAEIKRSLGQLTFDEDIEIVKRLAFECGSAAERFEKWQTAFTNPKRKVVNFKQINN